MKLKLVAAAAPLLLTLMTGAALANQTVDAPYVEKGEAYVEWKGGYLIDDEDDVDGSWVQEGNLGYGVTDFWNIELGGAVEHVDGDDDDTDFTGVTIDNRFELTQPGEYWLDFGFSGAYGIAPQDDAADSIEGKLLFAKEVGGFSNLANVIVGREVGGEAEDNDLTYGIALASSYAINDNLAAGLEWYSDFGDFDDESEDFDDQSHQLGPVVYGNFAESVGYEAGVLFGVSEGAPDATLKAVLNYAFSL